MIKPIQAVETFKTENTCNEAKAKTSNLAINQNVIPFYNKLETFITPINRTKETTEKLDAMNKLLEKQEELEQRIEKIEEKLSKKAESNLVDRLLNRVKELEKRIDSLEKDKKSKNKKRMNSINSIGRSLKMNTGKKFVLNDLLKNLQVKNKLKIKKNKFTKTSKCD